MNKLKTKFNGRILCVYAVIEKDIMVHLANIGTMTNRMYTTKDGFELIGTNTFKQNHSIQFYTDLEETRTTFGGTFMQPKVVIHKFDACVDFADYELTSVIDMCNREIEF